MPQKKPVVIEYPAYLTEGDHIWLSDEGWWFEDETNNFNGPYLTQVEAREAFATYCDAYL